MPDGPCSRGNMRDYSTLGQPGNEEGLPIWVERLTDQSLEGKQSVHSLLTALVTEAAIRTSIATGEEGYASPYATRALMGQAAAQFAEMIFAENEDGTAPEQQDAINRAYDLVFGDCVSRTAQYNKRLARVLSELRSYYVTLGKQLLSRARKMCANANAALASKDKDLADTKEQLQKTEEELGRYVEESRRQAMKMLEEKPECVQESVEAQLREELSESQNRTREETSRCGKLVVELSEVRNDYEHLLQKFSQQSEELQRVQAELQQERDASAQLVCQLSEARDTSSSQLHEFNSTKQRDDAEIERLNELLASIMEEASEVFRGLRSDSSQVAQRAVLTKSVQATAALTHVQLQTGEDGVVNEDLSEVADLTMTSMASEDLEGTQTMRQRRGRKSGDSRAQSRQERRTRAGSRGVQGGNGRSDRSPLASSDRVRALMDDSDSSDICADSSDENGEQCDFETTVKGSQRKRRGRSTGGSTKKSATTRRQTSGADDVDEARIVLPPSALVDASRSAPSGSVAGAAIFAQAGISLQQITEALATSGSPGAIERVAELAAIDAALQRLQDENSSLQSEVERLTRLNEQLCPENGQCRAGSTLMRPVHSRGGDGEGTSTPLIGETGGRSVRRRPALESPHGTTDQRAGTRTAYGDMQAQYQGGQRADMPYDQTDARGGSAYRDSRYGRQVDGGSVGGSGGYAYDDRDWNARSRGGRQDEAQLGASIPFRVDGLADSQRALVGSPDAPRTRDVHTRWGTRSTMTYYDKAVQCYRAGDSIFSSSTFTAPLADDRAVFSSALHQSHASEMSSQEVEPLLVQSLRQCAQGRPSDMRTLNLSETLSPDLRRSTNDRKQMMSVKGVQLQTTQRLAVTQIDSPIVAHSQSPKQRTPSPNASPLTTTPAMRRSSVTSAMGEPIRRPSVSLVPEEKPYDSAFDDLVQQIRGGGPIHVASTGHIGLDNVSSRRPRTLVWTIRHVVSIYSISHAQSYSLPAIDSPIQLPPLMALVWTYLRKNFGLTQLALQQGEQFVSSVAAYYKQNPEVALFARFLIHSAEDDVFWFIMGARHLLDLDHTHSSPSLPTFGTQVQVSSARQLTMRLFPSLTAERAEQVLLKAQQFSLSTRVQVTLAIGDPLPRDSALDETAQLGQYLDCGCVLLAWLQIFEDRRSAALLDLSHRFQQRLSEVDLSGATLGSSDLARVLRPVCPTWSEQALEQVTQGDDEDTVFTIEDVSALACRYDMIRQAIMLGLPFVTTLHPALRNHAIRVTSILTECLESRATRAIWVLRKSVDAADRAEVLQQLLTTCSTVSGSENAEAAISNYRRLHNVTELLTAAFPDFKGESVHLGALSAVIRSVLE